VAGINNAGKSYTLQSTTGGFNITDYAYKPGQSSGGGGRAPEPSTILLFGTQVAALVALRRRKHVRRTRQ
jgi:PEP-CTERM motif